MNNNELLIELLRHFAAFGSYWIFTTGSDLQRLYSFYCLQLSLPNFKIISTRSTLIKDVVETHFRGVLGYKRMPMRYGNAYKPTNCLVSLGHATQVERATFNGLTKHVAINDNEVTFVKARWLQSFYLAQRDKLALSA